MNIQQPVKLDDIINNHVQEENELWRTQSNDNGISNLYNNTQIMNGGFVDTIFDGQKKAFENFEDNANDNSDEPKIPKHTKKVSKLSK